MTVLKTIESILVIRTFVLLTIPPASPAGVGRCQHADYYYAVLQVGTLCARRCNGAKDASTTCYMHQLSRMCGPDYCKFRIHVQSSQANKTSGAALYYQSIPWDMEHNKDPANYVAGRQNRDQYVYRVKDDQSKNAGADCFKLLVTAWDWDPDDTYDRVTGTKELQPTLNLEPQLFKLKLEADATCINVYDNSYTGPMEVEVQILIIPFCYKNNAGKSIRISDFTTSANTFIDGKYKYIASSGYMSSDAQYLIETTAAQSMEQNGVLPCRVSFGDQWKSEDSGRRDDMVSGVLADATSGRPITCTDGVVFAERKS